MARPRPEFREEVVAALADVEQRGVELLTPPEPLDGGDLEELDHPPLRATQAVMPARQAVAGLPASRPWSFAAAMEPLFPTTLPANAGLIGERNGRPLTPPARDHSVVIDGELFDDASVRSGRGRRVAVGGVFGVLAVAALTIVGLRLSHVWPGLHSAPPTSSPAVTVTALRPVSASTPGDAAAAPTSAQFPAGTASLFLDVRYQGAASAPLQITVAVRPHDAASTIAGTTILNRAFLLNSSGDTVIPLVAPNGAFAAGDYTVTAKLNGSVLGSSSFAVG